MPQTSPLIRFLPAYVGSKQYWVPRLTELSGRPMAELFAGSAVLSANLASRALLVDFDPVIARVLARFDEQVVPEVFTRADYFDVRQSEDWWRYAYCLQSMSFSGVFRYSSKGYNVPHKGGGRSADDPSRAPRHNTRELRGDYEQALARWQELSPDVREGSYLDVTQADIAALGEDVLVVLDPPYQGSQAAYNTKRPFDYDAYWARVAELRGVFDLLLFDTADNLARAGFEVTDTRKMRVNGGRAGDVEAMSLIPRSHRA